nr:hypothetical protein [Tanacetum cinerariifolium]
MVNVIPPNYVDEVPVVEPNQHDDVLVVPEPVLVDPLNLSSPASESEPNDEIKVENPIQHKDETIPTSVHEIGESREMVHALVEKKGKAKDKFYGKLILELGNEVRSSVEQRMAAMEKLVEKLGNTEDKVECKKLKKELEEESGSGLIRGQDAAPAVCECTFVGFMKCNPAIFCEDKKVKFVAATLEGPALTWWKNKVATMGLETVKEYDVIAYSQRFNKLALMCPRMVEPEQVKVDAYILGLTDNIKGEVTSSKPADLNEAVHMAHKLME